MSAPRHHFLVSLVLIASGGLAGPSVEAQQRDPRAQDRAAIRRATREYLSAVHEGKSAEVAEFWTPNGVFIDVNGHESRGRELARQARPRTRDEKPDPRRADLDTVIRFVTPEVAIEDGTVPLPGASSPSDLMGHYSAVWVKHEDRWLLDSVRESLVRPSSPHDHLRALAWMIGDWRSEGGETTVEMDCHWSPDRNFLIREIHIQLPESRPVVVTQRIGWDASKRQIKAWSFDSAGGHGDAVWTPKDGQWVVVGTAVTPEGHEAASKSTYVPGGDGTFVWESTQATVAGESVPDKQLRMIRKVSEK